MLTDNAGGVEVSFGEVGHALILLTHRCNLACRFCEFSGQGDDRSEEEATIWIKTIEELLLVGLKQIVISGGEPLLYPQFEVILKHAAKRVDRVIVCTNGTELFRLRKPTSDLGRVQWTVSLHAAQPGAHDLLVGAPGAFRSAVDGIKLMRKRSPDARIAINIVCLNPQEDYRRMFELAGSIGVCQVTIHPLWKKNRGNRLESENLAEQIATDARHARELGIELIDLRSEGEVTVPNCHVARMGIVIDMAGESYPCMPVAGGFRPDSSRSFGNVFASGVSPVIRSRQFSSFRRRAWNYKTRFCRTCHAPLRKTSLSEHLRSIRALCAS